MPRMPKPWEGSQAGSWVSRVPFNSANNNVKLKIVEDRLREDLAPKDMEILPETSEVRGNSYLYIYDTQEKKLKRISANNLDGAILGDVGDKIEHENIINYQRVSKLPSISEAKTNTIYIVPANEKEPNNKYDEYLFIKETNEFNKFGSAELEIEKYRPSAEQDIIDQVLRDLISAVEQENEALKAELKAHAANRDNPHHVTKEQLGIDDSPELEFRNHYEFPNVGEPNKLYIATDENKIYYWKLDHYVVIEAETKMPDINLIDGGDSKSTFE